MSVSYLTSLNMANEKTMSEVVALGILDGSEVPFDAVGDNVFWLVAGSYIREILTGLHFVISSNVSVSYSLVNDATTNPAIICITDRGSAAEYSNVVPTTNVKQFTMDRDGVTIVIDPSSVESDFDGIINVRAVMAIGITPKFMNSGNQLTVTWSV